MMRKTLSMIGMVLAFITIVYSFFVKGDTVKFFGFENEYLGISPNLACIVQHNSKWLPQRN